MAPTLAPAPTARPAPRSSAACCGRRQRCARPIEEVYEPGHHALLAEERGKDLAGLHRAAEDDAIREAVRRQIELRPRRGQRRRVSPLHVPELVLRRGRRRRDRPNVVEFTNARGGHVELTVHSVAAIACAGSAAPPRGRPRSSPRSPTTRSRSRFPAASLFTHPFGVLPDAYESIEEFAAHAIEIERELDRRGDRGRLRLHPARLPPLPVPRRRRLDEPLSRRRARHRGSPRARARRRPDASSRASRTASRPASISAAATTGRAGFAAARWILSPSGMFSELPYDVFLDRMGRPRSRRRLRADPLRARRARLSRWGSSARRHASSRARTSC